MRDLRTCETCIRRPRAVGGNESCVILHRRLVLVGNREQRETAEQAWPRHLAQVGTCSSWKAGDRRERVEPVAAEALF